MAAPGIRIIGASALVVVAINDASERVFKNIVDLPLSSRLELDVPISQ